MIRLTTQHCWSQRTALSGGGIWYPHSPRVKFVVVEFQSKFWVPLFGETFSMSVAYAISVVRRFKASSKSCLVGNHAEVSVENALNAENMHTANKMEVLML